MKHPFFQFVAGRWSLTALSCIVLLSVVALNCDSPPGQSGTPGDHVLISDASGSSTFINDSAYQVPHDLPAGVLEGSDSNTNRVSQVALATFAWKEFIALNWPSSYDAKNGNLTRGKPNTSHGASEFLDAGKNPNQPLVWMTYKHRVEVYPQDISSYNTNFNTKPQYAYPGIPGQTAVTQLGDNSKTLATLDTIFNNLDETSEIDLCTLFVTGDSTATGARSYPDSSVAFLPGAPRRFIYEAKANEDFFNYVVNKRYYDPSVRNPSIDSTLYKISLSTPGDTFGAHTTCPDPNLICFPHGKLGGAEGSIEIKATWKQLTQAEFQSGRYLTAPVVYYRKGDPSNASDTAVHYVVVPGDGSGSELPFGLVGLHIIHKTHKVPSYVFATFEQVDNLNDSLPLNDLYYYNRTSNTFVKPGKQDVEERAHHMDLLPGTNQVNAMVKKEILAQNDSSVWQYYQLIGVQGPPNENKDTTDYFLANIVTETNETLGNFQGTLDQKSGAIKNPDANNVRKVNQGYNIGGCKGCHGNAQAADFSFITKNAPFNFNLTNPTEREYPPDVVNQPLLREKPHEIGVGTK